MDNVLFIDALCERGKLITELSEVIGNLDVASEEYQAAIKYLKFTVNSTIEDYKEAKAEVLREQQHQGFPKGVN